MALGKAPSCPPLPSASFSSSAQAQRRRWGTLPRPSSGQRTSVLELAMGPSLGFTWATSSSGDRAATAGASVTASFSQYRLSYLLPVGDTIRDSIILSVPSQRRAGYQQECWDATALEHLLAPARRSSVTLGESHHFLSL